MTSDEIKEFLPIENVTDIVTLQVEAGLEWVSNNTILMFNVNDISTIKALPSSVKLFLLKYLEIMDTNIAITSESIAGMSQSFDTSDKNALLWTIAQSLIGQYLKSGVNFVGAVKKW